MTRPRTRRSEIPAVWLDTNVIFRYLLGDHEVHSPEAARLVGKAAQGVIRLKVSMVVVMECCDAMRHVMKLERVAIAQALATFLDLPGIDTEEDGVVKDALDRYARRPAVDFVDAYLASYAVAKGPPHIATFNTRDFRRPGLVASRPDAW